MREIDGRSEDWFSGGGVGGLGGDGAAKLVGWGGLGWVRLGGVRW